MKILFIHGLASSGAYKMSDSLRILLKQSVVLAPDVPLEPSEALALLRKICIEESPDIVIGLSLGGFWAQKLRGYRKILINPDFNVSRLLRTKIGEQTYLSPRANGETTFVITEGICAAYEEVEKTQFNNLSEEEVALTTGMFADSDEIVNCGDEFELHYPGKRISYPGKHLPVFPELKKYLIPIVREMGF